MSKVEIELPNVWQSTKTAASQFKANAKLAKIDAILFVITIISIVWYAFDRAFPLEGFAGIMLVYSFGVVYRISGLKKRILDETKML